MSTISSEVSLDDKLADIYYDPASTGSFGGAERLYHAARAKGLNVTRSKVKRYLSNQQAYSLHKPVRRHISRNKTFVQRIDQQWQMDLADMQALASDNGGMHYILTCIDVFSKFAWAIPVHDKSGPTLVKALKLLFKLASPRRPERVQTDKGTEFFNKNVSKFFASENVHHFASNSDQKAAIIERFNRTLKSRLWTFFTANNTRTYTSILPEIIESYNSTYHRSIKMAPKAVNQNNSSAVWQNLYGRAGISGRTQPSKQVGDKTLVRISKWKSTFDKGYLPNWTREHFIVTKQYRQPRRVYKLEDKSGEPIEGVFYGEEIQPIDSNKYEIEKVIKWRKKRAGSLNNNSREAFVKWLGWPDKFNTWVCEDDLEQYGYNTNK